MTRRIFSYLAVFIMLLGVIGMAGCGKKNPSQSGAATNINMDAEEEYFLDIPSELKGTTVKYATWSSSRDGDPEFTNLTGMIFEPVHVPQSDYVVKIAGLIAADQAPDVIMENSDFPRTLNLLMPLTVEKTGIDVHDPFWDQDIVDLYTVGKYCYLVAGTRGSTGRAGACTYFNKTTLEENGLKTPKDLVEEDNWNLDSFRQLMGQIKASCGYQRAGTVIDVKAILAAFGAQEVIYDRETDRFANGTGTPQMLEGLKWLLNAQSEGLCELMLEGSHSNLENGTGAIQICGAFGLRSKPGWFYSMDPDDLDFTVLPKLKATDPDYAYTQAVGANGICIGSKNPIGAGYYLRYSLNAARDGQMNVEAYKSQEAMDLAVRLHENAAGKLANFSRGVRLCAFPDATSLTAGLMGEVVWTSPSQLAVKLTSVSNSVDTAVNKANELMEEFIAAQE